MAEEMGDLAGLVLLDGLICREVALCDRHMLELLGPGDVMVPAAGAEHPTLGGRVTLTAAADTLLIVLGESFIRAAARWPILLARVHQRLEGQRERLAIQGLIAHLPRAEHRLLLVLWHLAEHWGRVTPEGTVLPLALSHDLLAQLAAARRPTATLAVRKLEAERSIRRLVDGSWLLSESAQHHVDAIARSSDAADALGMSLMLRQQMRATSWEALALRAEARQIRAQRRASWRQRLDH